MALEAARVRYERDPGEKAASIDYARALRGEARYGEAAAVMQTAAVKAPKDEEILASTARRSPTPANWCRPRTCSPAPIRPTTRNGT